MENYICSYYNFLLDLEWDILHILKIENTPLINIVRLYEKYKYNYPNGFVFTYIIGALYEIVLDELIYKEYEYGKKYSKKESN